MANLIPSGSWKTSIQSGSSIGAAGNGNGISFNNHTLGQQVCAKVYIPIDVSKYKTIKLNCSAISLGGITSLWFGLFNYTDAIFTVYTQYWADFSASTVSAVDNLISLDNNNRTATINIPDGTTGTKYLGFLYLCNTSNSSIGGSTCGIAISSLTGTERNYNINLKAGNGISAISPATSNSIIPGNKITINATVKDEYRWKNWTNSSGSQLTTNQEYTFTPTKSETYTANAVKLCTVSFNSQGGSSISSKIIATGDAYGVLTTPTRSGYTFKGWYTAASGGTLITSSTIFNGTSNITLYAQWTANTYTVTLNPNGGTVSPTSISITYDNTYGILPIPTRNNYEFLGWYTSSSGGTQITPSTKYTTASNTTIYAQWQSNGTVRINIDGKSLLAQVFIFDNNAWHLTQPHTSFLNEWKLNGG